MKPHLAGIIPTITKPMDFRFDWHDVLMPIAPNFYAIERSVLECAYAGCDTIWIIANDNITPLVRHRIGDFVHDPVYLKRLSRNPSLERRPIPIFYVPMDIKHKNKRFCISWTILFGAQQAVNIGDSISKWISPQKFYVSYPFGIYPTSFLRKQRKDLIESDNIIFKSKERSLFTNDYLAFTFGRKELSAGLSDFKDTENSIIFGTKEEEFFQESMTLDKVFGRVIIDVYQEREAPWYYPIDNWENYCIFLSSNERKEIKHPGRLVISYREWNPIGYDFGKQ